MRLDNYDEFAEYIVAKFYEEDDIQAVCDYRLADLLMCEFGNMDYTDYKGIDLQSDVNEYYVTKFGEECFCVEPLKVDNKIKITTSDYFIIDSNILENNPTLFNYLEGNNFKVEIIDYDEECDCCEDENDGLFAFEYIYPWMEKDRPSLENAKFNSDYIAINNEDEEKLMCLKLADLIEEYVGLILDNDCKEEVLGHALTEFAGKVLEEFGVERKAEGGIVSYTGKAYI
ncbi:ATPases involved in chromosome partitioning [Clostridium botulinum B str. Osaka05]|uniref:ATPases involved in chromosome partitioning n=1 Tax=Clostridium botulinum B str. Osaka05 TaxID=1407017 RepID=A0A060N8T0_CLOBO|nr:hypothetical protein [Clostridium botulinum]BAO04908.1 ATPases involved in chromosome partitioning [Clostridium botulinum B str. Osaka05]